MRYHRTVPHPSAARTVRHSHRCAGRDRQAVQAKQVAEAMATSIQDILRPRCLVCHEEEARIVCVPCGHVCMCAHCAEGVKSTSGKCPLCRSPIHRYQKMAGSLDMTALEDPQLIAKVESLKAMMQDNAPVDRTIKCILNVNVLFAQRSPDQVRRVLKSTMLGKVLHRISTADEILWLQVGPEKEQKDVFKDYCNRMFNCTSVFMRTCAFLGF